MTGVGIAASCIVIARLTTLVSRGHAFDAFTVRLLRVLAVSVVGAGTLGPALTKIAQIVAVDRLVDLVGPDGFEFLFSWALVTWAFVGAAIAMVAQAFVVGGRLADDAAGTI